MSNAQKIGIYGGSFNPVHNGHVNLAKNYIKHLELDLLLVIPTRIPPHKTNSHLANGEDRLNMLKLAFEGVSAVEVSDIELTSNETNYTIITLEKLIKIYPNSQFYLIVGGDMFLSFDTWREYERIMSMCKVCAAPRHAGEIEEIYKFRNKIDPNETKTIILDQNVIDISSTQVRENAKKREELKNLVPEKVFEYIVLKDLYRND